MELASQSRQGPAFLSGTGNVVPVIGRFTGSWSMAMTSDVDGAKINLWYSHNVGGEFESGLRKCGTQPPPMNKSANGRDRTWPSVSPRDPAISVLRSTISRSLRTNARKVCRAARYRANYSPSPTRSITSVISTPAPDEGTLLGISNRSNRLSHGLPVGIRNDRKCERYSARAEPCAARSRKLRCKP
jgi:hypothetical protein